MDSVYLKYPNTLLTTSLQSLDTSKANGLDGISARMLKSTAHSIAPSITKTF